jgi:hypothetical protein
MEISFIHSACLYEGNFRLNTDNRLCRTERSEASPLYPNKLSYFSFKRFLFPIHHFPSTPEVNILRHVFPSHPMTTQTCKYLGPRTVVYKIDHEDTLTPAWVSTALRDNRNFFDETLIKSWSLKINSL